MDTNGAMPCVGSSSTNRKEGSPFDYDASPALLVHMSPTHCWFSLLYKDGTHLSLTTKNHNQTRGKIVPLAMGIIQGNFFAFGHSVYRYVDAKNNNPVLWKKKVAWWNFGRSLVHKENPTIMFVQDEKLKYLKLDLVLGIFLNYWKGLVETKINSISGNGANYQVIKKIVFVVPFWYNNIVRKRHRDAGEIAGFEESCTVDDSDVTAEFVLNDLLSRSCMGFDSRFRLKDDYGDKNNRDMVKQEWEGEEISLWHSGRWAYFSEQGSGLVRKPKDKCVKQRKEMMDCSAKYQREVARMRRDLWILSETIAVGLREDQQKKRLGHREKADLEKTALIIMELLSRTSKNRLMKLDREELKQLFGQLQPYRTYF